MTPSQPYTAAVGSKAGAVRHIPTRLSELSINYRTKRSQDGSELDNTLKKSEK